MEECIKKCSNNLFYQCGLKYGYEEGLKAGLSQANELVGKLLKEQQVKMDNLSVYEGEE